MLPGRIAFATRSGNVCCPVRQFLLPSWVAITTQLGNFRGRIGYPLHVFDKLDMKRIANLLSMVTGSDFGQIFITDSNKVRMAGLVDSLTDDRAYFECTAGTFARQ